MRFLEFLHTGLVVANAINLLRDCLHLHLPERDEIFEPLRRRSHLSPCRATLIQTVAGGESYKRGLAAKTNQTCSRTDAKSECAQLTCIVISESVMTMWQLANFSTDRRARRKHVVHTCTFVGTLLRWKKKNNCCRTDSSVILCVNFYLLCSDLCIKCVLMDEVMSDPVCSHFHETILCTFHCF